MPEPPSGAAPTRRRSKPALVPSPSPLNSAEPAAASAIDHSAGLPETRTSIQHHLIHWLEARHRFALAPSGLLHRFDPTSGRYIQAGERWVNEQIREMLERPSQKGEGSGGLGRYTIDLARTVNSVLGLKKPQLWPRPPLDQICLLNGIWNLHESRLLPHSPAWLSTAQIPVRYDPLAPADRWTRFLSAIFPPDAVGLAWEVIGSSLLPNHSVQEAIWLQGPGGNGKSTFIMALQRLLGPENCLICSFREMSKNRFAPADLVGRLLVADPDSELHQVAESALFKKIVTGDSLRVEQKFRDSFEFSPFCSVLLAGNVAPSSPDESEGFLRRLVLVPFTGLGDRSLWRPQHELLDELSASEALSGALNLALEGLYRVRKRGFYDQPPSVREITEEFRAASDPIRQFFSEYVEFGPDFSVPKPDLIAAYNEWAVENRRRRTNPVNLGLWIRKNIDGIRGNRPETGNPDRSRAYLGMRLKFSLPSA